MLHEDADSSLANFFLAVIAAERQTDVYRSLLAEQPGFDPFLCFCAMDSSRSGFLSGVDFEQFMRESGEPVNEAEGRVLAGIFDWDGDRKVSYRDFLTKIGLKALRDNTELQGSDIEPRHALARLLLRELESLRRMSSALVDQRIELGWKCLYNALLTGLHSKVSAEDLIQFLRVHGIPVDQSGVEAVFRVFDRDRDGEIGFGDFLLTVKLLYKGISSKINVLIEKQVEECCFDYRPRGKPVKKKQGKARLAETTSQAELHSHKTETFMSSGKLRMSHSTTVSPISSPKLTPKHEFSASGTSPKSLLLSFLSLQLSVVRDLEQQKVILSKRSDFHPWTCFSFLRPSRRNFLTVTDLLEGAQRCGVQLSEADVRRLMLSYNCSGDMKLKFTEFTEMVAPLHIDRSRVTALPLQPETITGFAQLLLNLVEMEKTIDSARKALSRNAVFKHSEAFAVLDRERKGSVSQEEFAEALSRSGLVDSEEEAFALFKRYDKNRDGKLSYAEFVQEIA